MVFKIELFFQDPVDLLFDNFKINTTFILILLKKKCVLKVAMSLIIQLSIDFQFYDFHMTLFTDTFRILMSF